MSAPPTDVVVHPLVLLSVVDHYNRVAKDSKRGRVVGVVLGEVFKGRVDITNSFALPFEEDPKDPRIWFLDHDYLESMFQMFKKVNAREKIVGFYSSGPRIRPGDLAIEELFRKYLPHPVLTIIDVRPDCDEIPTQAYFSVETVVEGEEPTRTFAHVPSEVGAYEAEEVGVEHLLRDINDPSVSSLGAEMRHKLNGLKGMAGRLKQMSDYLRNVMEERLPANNTILDNMQQTLNLLPNLSVKTLVEAMYVSTNDMHLVMYVSSMIRSVIALHNLVLNKLKYKDDEETRDKDDKDKDKTKGEADEKKESEGKTGEAGPGAGAGAGAGSGKK